jgi:hypothetical protein
MYALRVPVHMQNTIKKEGRKEEEKLSSYTPEFPPLILSIQGPFYRNFFSPLPALRSLGY